MSARRPSTLAGAPAASCRLSLSYVIALRWTDGRERDALRRYLSELAELCEEVIVVDGSPPALFAANGRAWEPWVSHLEPDRDVACKMGKVAGIHTGVRRARHERIVLADDDVRYDREALLRVAELLAVHDLVRPQNFFEPLPWHARWDTARTLLNRALGGDYPGTLGVRRSCMVAIGGYDGDVIFENLELIRTVEAHGASAVTALDLYVRRTPPTSAHFWGQRTRQAYDEFANPLRMASSLAVLPSLARAVLHRRGRSVLGAALGAVLVAELGRRRANGRTRFPAGASLLAPAWILERGLCAWLAVLQRVRFGGVRYRGGVVRTAAHSRRELRRRARQGHRSVAFSSVGTVAPREQLERVWERVN